MGKAKSLRNYEKPGEWGSSKSGRLLQSIRLDMDLKEQVFRNRRRNEEILSLSYQEGDNLGGSDQNRNLRENALNLPFRQARWIESRATSKKLVVKVNRDAGAGQKPGGPRDDETGMWVGVALERVAHMGGYRREMNAVIGEVLPRGTSVMRIGYHEQTINLSDSGQVGKNAQSVVAEVLGEGDVEAKPGQDHDEIARGLGVMLDDPETLASINREGRAAMQARQASHIEAQYQDDTTQIPRESTRLIRRKLWMQKRRVGEDVGWAPWVYDIENTPFWWERHVWTVAEVRRSNLFTDAFKRAVEGYDGRTVSGVFHGGKTPSDDSMDSYGREAQTDQVLDADERLVEWFEVWFREPEMKSGGTRKMVAPESPDEFIQTDDANPHVDENGKPLIQGFYPYYDFTPYLSSMTVPQRTLGIPPVASGMPQFEKIAEYNRLRHEAALKGATRIVQIHNGLKDAKKVLDALNNGEIGYAFISPPALSDSTGKMHDAVKVYSFSGTNPEIANETAYEEASWIKMSGMPPAILQGQGTAPTATQDAQGIRAGENESNALLIYFGQRMAAVMEGLRGLMRGNLDDEDFILMLGQEGAAVMKAWQQGTSDEGDEIIVSFGMDSESQEIVERKQLMEAINLIRGEIEPLTQLPKFDHTILLEELFRRLNVGAPKPDETPMKQLQQMILLLSQQVQELTGVNPLTGEGQPTEGGEGGPKPTKKPTSGEKKQSHGGPNPSEGDGPTAGNIQSGAVHDTLPQGV